ncbi:MAG: c-type cytochrome [Allosphingosinicella sp.]|uniref:c-type cytochrome n=1 Tax=Allosphingosinicella sp. TaxID=2823234 RepID=UPI003934C1BD
MSSPCRTSLALLALLALAGCDRERRDYRGQPVAETGPVLASGVDPRAEAYQINAWQIGQGQRWYMAFNCVGCHGMGGGGMGPPLIDDEWRYGGEMEDIVRTILDGRPNGMPSFDGRITGNQAWQIAAFVRSLGAHTPMDTRPGRTEDLMAREPLSLEERMPPRRVTPEEDAATLEANPE